MPTRVGEETDPLRMLEHLMALDYDAVEAYQAAIDRVENAEYRRSLESFKADHERHVRELEPVIQELGGDPATGPGAKSMLTKGKVQMGSLAGDQAILRAMLSNEEETNYAYEKAFPQVPSKARDLLMRGREDERRHWNWIASKLKGDYGEPTELIAPSRTK